MRTLKFLEIEASGNAQQQESDYFCSYFDCRYNALATTRIVLTKSGGRPTFIFYLCEEHAQLYLRKVGSGVCESWIYQL